MYICLDSVEKCNLCSQHSDTDGSGVSWESESESLSEALRGLNTHVETLLPLTDFRTGSPHFLSTLGFLAKLVLFEWTDEVGDF